MKMILPLCFALLAATGNALFAFGQKADQGKMGGLWFIGFSSFIAFVVSSFYSLMVGPINLSQWKDSGKYVLMSGIGLFFTFLGFHLLFSRYGVTYYALYAVLSILTTSVVVGLIIFRESVNGMHWAAIASAILTVLLFSMAQARNGE